MIKLNSQKLRVAQARECLSINELASKSGISRVTISQIINDERNPKEKTIGLLARALNIDVTELIDN